MPAKNGLRDPVHVKVLDSDRWRVNVQDPHGGEEAGARLFVHAHEVVTLDFPPILVGDRGSSFWAMLFH